MINLKSTSTVKSGTIKMLAYGPSGSGKTSLIPTLPSPVILSAEGGLLSISDKEIPFLDISDMEALREAYKWLAGSDEAKQFASVAIDSIPEIAEVCLGKEKAIAKDPRAECFTAHRCRETRRVRRCRIISTLLPLCGLRKTRKA